MADKCVLRGVVSRATTLVDGGWRVSFDLPDDAPVSDLIQLRGEDVTIVVMCSSQLGTDNAVDL